jgi:hypothetical protein
MCPNEWAFSLSLDTRAVRSEIADYDLQTRHTLALKFSGVVYVDSNRCIERAFEYYLQIYHITSYAIRSLVRIAGAL